MKQQNFKFYTFEQNYNELRNKLLYIRRNMLENKYEQNVEKNLDSIDGLEGSVLRSFKSFAQLDEFIDELNDKLSKLNITVLPSSVLDSIQDIENDEISLTRSKIYKDYYRKILLKNKDIIKEDLFFESEFIDFNNPDDFVNDIKRRIVEKSLDEKAIEIPDFKTFYNEMPASIKENYSFHSTLSVKVIRYIKEKRVRNCSKFSDCKLFGSVTKTGPV
ncbi:MAG: hypothetical protein A2Y33_03375 [Spirochaetes bacterium GWF1_51_8]|nr:MAG: hypothetical protein A2Y33_03375 [Spirochaetes bacterium GWF1_51_8]